MKRIFFLSALILAGCNSGDQQNQSPVNSEEVQDSIAVTKQPNNKTEITKQPDSLPLAKVYSNKRFKEVTVKKTGYHKFNVHGKAQIFEASFSWIVEDGHEELKKGFQITDTGAPEWGKFSFTVDVEKKRPNSTLHLILFEASPKDGSRQHELPVLLY